MPRSRRDAAGSWLEGPSLPRAQPRGDRLGLPPTGPGSPASGAARVGAFVVDAITANLLVGIPVLFGVKYGHGDRGTAVYAAFLLQEFLLVSLSGATVGKRLFGLLVIRASGGRVPPQWVLVRTVLLGVLLPAVIWDGDGRGLHDRAAGSIVVRQPRPADVAAAGMSRPVGNRPGRSQPQARTRGPVQNRPNQRSRSGRKRRR